MISTARHHFCSMTLLAALVVAPGTALAQGYPGYPNTIMVPERGAGVHYRANAPRRAARARAAHLPHISRNSRQARRNVRTVRGSSGSVLPTPLPRTALIPPEGGRTATLHLAPREQVPSVVPGISNPVPNLPHGTETFQDRASRCAFQQGLYNVPGHMSTGYTAACVQ